MVWKNRAWTAGALLLCTSMLIGAQPANTARSAGEQAQILGSLGEEGLLSPAAPLTGKTGVVQIQGSVTEPKPGSAAAIQKEVDALTEQWNAAMDAGDAELATRLATAIEQLTKPEREPNPFRGPVDCDFCSSAASDANLDPIPTTQWGGSVSGDCGTNGSWMGEFTAAANEKIHFDICDHGAAVTDLDIHILANDGGGAAVCTNLGGEDGSSSCSASAAWNPSDYVFTAPAAGTYFVVIAPYRSYNQVLCAGDAGDTFTMAYYSEGVVGPTPGDTCADPLYITLPADMAPTYVDVNTTCDRGNSYEDTTDTATCMSYYTSGEDIFYDLTVTSDVCVDISLVGDTSYAGISVDETCPPSGSCNGVAISSATSKSIEGLFLPAGSYSIMIDTWSTPYCINEYTLTISECATGACCDAGMCTVGYEATCAGTYLGDGTDCTGDPCSLGACCFDDGSCRVLTSMDCATSNGVYSGDGSDCTPNECPQPCTCDVTTGGFCTDFGAAAGDLGLWTQSADDDFDWTLTSAATPSSGTGPTADHTTGTGYYIFIETSSGVVGDEAILDAPCVDLSTMTNPAISFWYHMYGATMGTLSVQVSADNCLSWDTVWTLSGDQGNQWYFGQTDLSAYAGQTVHVRFVGVHGTSYTGDIALDDICFGEFQVFDGGCCDLDTGSCLGVMDEASCAAAGNTAWYILADCTSNNFCPQPPPANDECANATVIGSLPFADLGVNTIDATPDIDISCNSSSCTGTSYGVWYTYTPTADCEASIVVAGDDTSTALFTGTDCGTLTELACSDPQTATYDLQAGVQYWVLVGHYSCSSVPSANIDVSIDCVNGACCTNGLCTVETPTSCTSLGGIYVGDGTDCTGDPCTTGACCIGAACQVETEADCLNLGGIYHGNGTSCSTAVCNDDCDVAEVVTDGTPAAEGDNCAAGADLVEASCQADSSKDVWFEYTATCTGTVTIDTEGSGQSDTVLSIYDACSNGVELACDDDGGNGLLSMVNYNTIAGTTVLVRVASYSAGCGDYNLNIVCDEAPTGACCNAGACTIDYQLTCEAAGGVYAGDLTACAGDDCNANGSDDACEILENPALDCNDNAVPDDCDIAGATSSDCDGNGAPDECDPDCNANGIVDGCDISCGADCAACYGASCGLIDDCQPDGIPDDCQLGGGSRAVQYFYDDGTLENSLGISAGADICALQHYTIVDGAETIVSIEVAWGGITAGSTGTVYVWNDPNGDGDPSDAQVIASAAVVANDPDNNTFEVYPITPTNVGPAGTSFFVGFLMASAEYPAGMDEDGTLADESWIAGDINYAIDPNDLANPAYNNPLSKFSAIGFPSNLMVRANGEASGADCNANGIPDECDIADCADPFNDPNCSDCDGNGVVDICEYVDCDGSGTHDACDIAQGADDCDGNGVPDKCDPDCDGNDIPDACEPDQSDCNDNGIIDLCDIAGGASNDCQPDGVPDECQLGEVGGVVLTEGFEDTVPPAGWTLVAQNASYTWKAEPNTYAEGVQSADVEYDPALTPQNEWLLTPTLSLSGTVTLSGWTMGSIYWGRDVFDNYDVQVWSIVGALDGVDDTFIGLLDDIWPDNYVWTQFTMPFPAPASAFRIGFLYQGVDGAQAGIDGIAVEGVAGVPLNDCDEDGIPDDCQLCGDLDRDGDVDVVDYQAFRTAYASSEGDANYVACYDFDRNGQIGLTDYRAWLQCYRDFIGNPLAGPPALPAGGAIKPIPSRNGDLGQPTQLKQ